MPVPKLIPEYTIDDYLAWEGEWEKSGCGTLSEDRSGLGNVARMAFEQRKLRQDGRHADPL
ncbi:MAG: hypothetical protein AAF802_27115 [Planctomycetota bacterium]